MATTPWTDAVHTYEPDAEGRCTSGWRNDRGEWVECRSTQRSSVLHDDPEAAFREMHDHGGGDCMCFEDPEGPSFYEAMRRWCYPTDEEIAEDERRAEANRRRSRRVRALSDGLAITRIAKTVTENDPHMRRKVDRVMKLSRWGVQS